MTDKIWTRKRKGGCVPEFLHSDHLWSAACEYFEWAVANPLIEQKPMSIAGELVIAEIEKPRVFTFEAMCLYLDVSHRSYMRWRKDERFMDACEKIDAVVYSQKFEGAAAGFFNANLISRDLGLAEKQDLTTNGESLNKPTVINLVGKVDEN